MKYTILFLGTMGVLLLPVVLICAWLNGCLSSLAGHDHSYVF